MKANDHIKERQEKMLKDMKPIRMIRVGDLVRHTGSGSSIWDGCVGIVTRLPKTHITDICSYPTILWSDGQIGTAHRQYLEIVSESQ